MATKTVAGQGGQLIEIEVEDTYKYSVRKIAGEIRGLGKTKAVRDALMEADAYEMYVGANYLSSEDEDFRTFRVVIQQILGLTDEQMEAMLTRCIWSAE